MDTQFLSQAGAQVAAAAAQTRLANSVLHLFKSSFTPNPTSVLTDYLAAECDFDNYGSGTIAAWGAPVLAPGNGWMTFAPTQVFTWVHVAADVTNSVGGTFLVDAGGNLIDVVIFGTPIPMSGPGQAVIVTPVEVFPTTPSVG